METYRRRGLRRATALLAGLTVTSMVMGWAREGINLEVEQLH